MIPVATLHCCLVALAATAPGSPIAVDQGHPRTEVDLDDDGDPEFLEMRSISSGASLALRFFLTHTAGGPEQLIFAHDEAEPWAYGMRVRDLDADGRLDLEYWAGTDIGNEVVWLLNEGEAFRALRLGFIRDVYDYTALFPFDERSHARGALEALPGEGPAPVARWNAEQRTFEGLTVRWVDGDRVALRAEPSREAAEIMRLPSGGLVHYLGLGPEETLDGERHPWVHVRWDEGIDGWIWGRYLANTVPVERWPREPGLGVPSP